jgi:pyrimidine operon attenuation protein/uracil phosphoribosyltransferase
VIPAYISGKPVVVVDYFLSTGRRVRAALAALSYIARALTTELAVLVDRGHWYLPIRADYVGRTFLHPETRRCGSDSRTLTAGKVSTSRSSK